MRRATFATGESLAKQLEDIIKGEREAELKGIGKNIVRSIVESVRDDLATIHCTPPLFEEGDVLARVSGGLAKSLSVVIVGESTCSLNSLEKM